MSIAGTATPTMERRMILAIWSGINSRLRATTSFATMDASRNISVSSVLIRAARIATVATLANSSGSSSKSPVKRAPSAVAPGRTARRNAE